MAQPRDYSTENPLQNVIGLRDEHAQTWRNMPEDYWYSRLVQEVIELGLAMDGRHIDTPDWELTQIAAICLNWLEMRKSNTRAG